MSPGETAVTEVNGGAERSAPKQGVACVAVRSLQPITERRITGILERAGFSVAPVGAAPAGHAAVLAVETIDADLPGLVREARARGAAVVVLVVRSVTHRTLREALAAGIDGVVLSQRAIEALGPTVTAVLAGQLVTPHELRPPSLTKVLSRREKQVLALVVLGFSNAEIALKLFLAESTVKSHVSSAFSKLGVRTRSEASALILDPATGFGTGILTILAEEESSG